MHIVKQQASFDNSIANKEISQKDGAFDQRDTAINIPQLPEKSKPRQILVMEDRIEKYWRLRHLQEPKKRLEDREYANTENSSKVREVYNMVLSKKAKTGWGVALDTPLRWNERWAASEVPRKHNV